MSELAVAIKKAGADCDPDEWEKLSIYRIPQCLRHSDDKAYIPQTVSLGPYHHLKKRLSGMEEHKRRALHRMLERNPYKGIEVYLEAAKDMEKHARACYEGPIDLNSNEFVQMLVLDSAFVLELFRGDVEGFDRLGYSPSDPIFAKRVAMTYFRRDMIMLENQIPLFVLDRIYGIQCTGGAQAGAVAKLALRFFKSLVPDLPLATAEDGPTDQPSATAEEPKQPEPEPKPTSDDEADNLDGVHCLDVFCRSLLCTPPKSADQRHKKWSLARRMRKLIRCATELKEAGVKFKVKKTDRFCDFDFNDGVLEIPGLVVHGDTKSLFMNLIAFEQCHLDCGNDITSYAILIDSLIDSPADVRHLHYCGIVKNCLGSYVEVAELFNSLCHEVVFDFKNSWLSPVSEKVSRYCDRSSNEWMATLKHYYFNNPLSGIPFIAATVLLIFTFVQTFFAVYAYFVPPSS